MRFSKLGLAAVVAVSAVSLAGCADEYGYGYGPYSGVSLGVGYGGGYGYGYSPYYGDSFYGGYGYYGSPFGWYDDFYYPGTGIYVYDSYRRPRMWNDYQRRYWTNRTDTWRHRSGSTYNSATTTPNWSGFDRHQSTDRRRYR